MEGEVQQVAQQLAAAVELAMANSVPQQQRLEAYNACEQFKEKSPLCVQCGLYLAQQPQFSQVVRHFGLQLMEHCIKYRWYNLTQAEKIYVKENAMKLIEGSVSVEQAHIKDAVSRVIVEMIKREWPQQWPTLLTELSQACMNGCMQTELVLLVFLRLAEDVVVLQTLESTQRRKDLYQALTTNMADIFAFFLKLIEDHYQKHVLALEQGLVNDAATHARVVQVVLLTLSGFVEWVTMTHIMANEGKMLQILCLLLKNETFQTPAAECLLQIVSRKGKAEERRPLLILFSADAMACMFHAAGVASEKGLDEKHYVFLKKLTQVLTGIGTQLCSLWGKDDGQTRPPNFSMYMEAIATFSRHPSLTVAHYANALWTAFFKHELISKDSVFLSFLPKWVEASAPKIMKVVFPTVKGATNPSESAPYAVLDYDSEEEFNNFFYRYRFDMLETFKLATLVAPLVTFTYMQEWLTVRIQKTLTIPEPLCTLQSPSYIEWEALSMGLEAVLSRIVMCSERPAVNTGLHLLDLCLALEPQDPLILSTLLSCISALFVFLSMNPREASSHYLPRVLDKIFSTLVFTLPGDTKETRSRSVRNVRRHAASLMVKIGQKYPLLLLPVFDRIKVIVHDLESKADTLSTLEIVCLQEALLLISNHFCEYERESAFVGEVVRPVADKWLVMAAEAFTSPQAFMAFVGLDKPPVEPSTNDINGRHRSQVMNAVEVVSAVVKRCAWPEDPDRALRGGFLVGRTEAGNPIYRNPATPHLLPLLPGLLALIKVFNSLWTPEAQTHLSPGYINALAMVEIDRNNLLGIPTQTEPFDMRPPQTPQQRMQTFLTQVYDTCYQILGQAFPSLSRDLYQLPHLADSLSVTVLANLQYIPDYRLRPMIRWFFKPFVASCPSDCYDTTVVPVLAQFTPYMFTRLNTRWQHLAEMQESGSNDDENTDAQEMLEDMLNRTVTREYLDMVKLALVGGNAAELSQGSSPAMEDDSELKPVHTTEVISELGLRVLHCEPTCQAVTLSLISALWWNDSHGSMKACTLVGQVMKHLVNVGRVSAPLASHAVTAVLQGLQVHGQHDANQGSLLLLGTQLYELLRPTFPQILEVLKQIPDVNPLDLQKLDERMLKEAQKGNKVEKAKKEMFKKITAPLHGQNIGQLFRRKAFIRELPRTEGSHRKKNPNLLGNGTTETDIIPFNFFKVT